MKSDLRASSPIAQTEEIAQSRSATNQISPDTICNLDWIKRRDYPELSPDADRPIRLIDVFSGCGGLTLGAYEAARLLGRPLDIRAAFEVDEDALEVYLSNFAHLMANVGLGDVTRTFSTDLGISETAVETLARRTLGDVEVILAGPPCQGHSDLNNQTRRNDPRNQLYFVPVRMAELLKPKVLVIENVPTVVHATDRVVHHAKQHLQQMGYSVFERRVRLELLGVPQSRRRHVIVAVLGSLSYDPLAEVESDNSRVTVHDFIHDLEDEPSASSHPFRIEPTTTERNRARIDYLFENEVYDLPNAMRPRCHQNETHSYSSMYGRLRPNQVAQTITTGFGSMGQGRFVHPSRRRMITPHEAARLQGFPDFFYFESGAKVTSLRQMIGNAVPPALSARILFSLGLRGTF